MAAIAQVEPLTTARALRGPFDYRLPEHLREVEVGTLLRIPFGRQRLLGVVVGTGDRSEVPDERLVEPLGAIGSGAPPELVELGLWVARDCGSTAARGLALVLPPGGGELARPRLALQVTLTQAGEEALEGSERLTERQREVLVALRGSGLAAADLCRRTGSDHGGLRRLELRGLVALETSAVRRRPSGPAPAVAEEVPQATPEQERAVETIVAALASGGGRFLLHGVTGSGKTEVYLRAAATALEQGRSAIILVPEIGLTPQAVARFRARFGELVAVLHSKLSAGERADEWRRLRDGEARVAVGPRSAVFAPLSRLGLVVVDEEHDSSYKQTSDPRYDARRVAERRARTCGAVLVCGSATPRAESYERLPRLRLDRRVDGRPLPPVAVLDMRGTNGALHPDTREALDAVRRRGQKAIVLLNRRGWSPYLACRQCGRLWGCPECDVSLTLHRSERGSRLACHHCGHSEPVPRACDGCGSVSIARHGAGTERVEAELSAALEPLPVFRLDSDAARVKHGAARTLERFAAAPAGVLVGTQMVAKGHDFPEVTLGVVLDADSTLRFPDFRSEERTFALVAQLAGRSGRGAGGGRVLVQTLAPEAPSIVHAAQHDSEGFLGAELARRRALNYPPFIELVEVICSAPQAEAAQRAAERVAAALEPEPLRVLGPAPLFRLRGRERRRLLVKCSDREAAAAAVGEATSQASRGARGVSFSVDVDPQ